MNMFDHERDPELGGALKKALQPADPQRFVRRVMDAADRLRLSSKNSFWEILGEWAKPGMAAAVFLSAVAIAAAVFALRPAPELEATIDDALQRDVLAPERSLLMASPNPPTVDIVLAVSVER